MKMQLYTLGVILAFIFVLSLCVRPARPEVVDRCVLVEHAVQKAGTRNPVVLEEMAKSYGVKVTDEMRHQARACLHASLRKRVSNRGR